MSLLEVQVADLREDMTVVQAGVVELDEDVDFLFDEQVIQDEKLLDLEQAVNVIESDLIVIDADVESEQEIYTYLCLMIVFLNVSVFRV